MGHLVKFKRMKTYGSKFLLQPRFRNFKIYNISPKNALIFKIRLKR